MLVLFHSSSSSHSNSSSDFGFSCGGGGKQTEYENRFAEYEDEDELNIPGLLTGYRNSRPKLARRNWTGIFHFGALNKRANGAKSQVRV